MHHRKPFLIDVRLRLRSPRLRRERPQDRLSEEKIAWELGVSALGSAPKNGRQRLDDFLALLVFGGRPRTNEICKALRMGFNATSRMKTILTWPSDLYEISFSNCDNRKSHPQVMEEKRPLRRQPEDHHFWSLIMLAVTGRRLSTGRLDSNKGAVFLSSSGPDPLRSDWQRHVLASSGYLELGMLDDAVLALEEIASEDKTRSEILSARIDIYLAAEKWDMAATVANHLVKVEPGNCGWWIKLANATRRCEKR